MTTQKCIITNSAEDSATISMNLNKDEIRLLNDVFDRLNNDGGTYAPTINLSLANPQEAKIKKIWTQVYQPFVMGGNVRQAMCTNVHIFEERTINEFDFFSIRTPRGSVKICEAYTGGIIADSFEEVERNLAGVEKEVLQYQLDSAKNLANQAVEKTYEEFFSLYHY